MPATYEPIATTTLGSAATSIIFSSIPNTYTDLKISFVYSGSAAFNFGYMSFNNDTGSNYSWTWLSGNGASAQSSRTTNNAGILLDPSGGSSTTIPFYCSIDVFSYAGSTNKTSLITMSQDQNGSGRITNSVALWRNTSAINRIDLYLSGSGNTFAAGTTATLYGILKA